MAGADERLRCWAAGVEVAQQLEAARENSRRILGLLQQGVDPNTSTTFRTEAANYRLHVGAVEEGIRDAERCGETPVVLSWIGEFRRFALGIGSVPSYEEDAHSQVQELDSVIDWLQRDTAGIPRPGEAAHPPVGTQAEPFQTDRGDYGLRDKATGAHLTYGYFNTLAEAQEAARKIAYPPFSNPRYPHLGTNPPVGGAQPGEYPFIAAERHWDSLDLAGREALIRQIGEDPAAYTDLADRSFGELDPDAIDALEGMAAQEAHRRARGG
jgi:hypothetical protein